MPSTSMTAEQSWTTLADEIERVFADLRQSADAFHAAYASRQDRFALADLAPLRPRIHATLDAFSDIAVGTGIVVAPGVLGDAPYWLEWWWRQADGTPEALRANLDPRAPDFFDYPDDEWFEVPIRTGTRHVTGPYLDYACTNQYTFTFSVPIHHGSRPLGVAAMDVPCDNLERRIMPALCAEPTPLALVNAGCRVIAANTHTAPPGERLAGRIEQPDGTDTTHPAGLARLCALTGWALATVPIS